MSWSPRSDRPGPLDLELGLPVTGEDREALRRHRQGQRRRLLERVELLAWPAWLPAPHDRRPTHEGFEPFEL